jgi:hypothetical protein
MFEPKSEGEDEGEDKTGEENSEDEQGSEFYVDFLDEAQNTYLKKRYDKFKTLSGDQISEKVKSNLPTVMFFVLPLFALVLKITNIFKGRFYAEHFVVALYAQSYLFIMLTVLYLFEAGGRHLMTTDEYSAIGASIISLSEWGGYWMLFHLFLMQKSIYKQSWFGASCQYILNLTLYGICLAITFATAMIWNFVTLDV